MKNSLIDISGRVNKNIIEILCILDEVASKAETPFLLIGAMARDFLFEYYFDIQAPRATLDVDIGIKVRDWKTYNELLAELLKLKYVKKTNLEHRIEYKSVLIDIVPFGNIMSKENGLVVWQFDKDVTLNVLVFQSVLDSSIEICVQNSPPLIIKLPSIPGLLALKLISWYHAYPNRSKDAKDIKFILNNYEFTIDDEELFSHEDILKKEKFDTKYAAIRVMGREIRRMLDDNEFEYLKTILTEEFNEEYSKLVFHMMDRNDNYEDVLFHLLKLKAGMEDVQES